METRIFGEIFPKTVSQKFKFFLNLFKKAKTPTSRNLTSFRPKCANISKTLKTKKNIKSVIVRDVIDKISRTGEKPPPPLHPTLLWTSMLSEPSWAEV